MNAAIQEARQRGMQMFELEAYLALETLQSARANDVWSGPDMSWSRSDIQTALERARGSRVFDA